MDAGKIRRELDWRPRWTAGDGFRATVQWYLENEAWYRAILD
jgi:dTDP-glucose 4,6-dehydratase